MSDLSVATHELVRVVWSAVGILAAAVHLWLWLVWVLWFQLKLCLASHLIKYSTQSSTYFTLCHRVKALECVVGRVEDVEERLEASDHVLVTLAYGVGTSASRVGANDFIVDNVEIVIHLFRNAVGTVIKSDTTVTLLEANFSNLSGTCKYLVKIQKILNNRN